MKKKLPLFSFLFACLLFSWWIFQQLLIFHGRFEAWEIFLCVIFLCVKINLMFFHVTINFSCSCSWTYPCCHEFFLLIYLILKMHKPFLWSLAASVCTYCRENLSNHNWIFFLSIIGMAHASRHHFIYSYLLTEYY